MMQNMKCKLALFAAGILALCLASPIPAQPTYSIDFQGPTISTPDGCTLLPITEGDMLSNIPPGTPPPAPCQVVGPGALAIAPGALGFFEVDALSYGTEIPVPDLVITQWQFSVDEFAMGLPGGGAMTMAAGATEASADVFFTNTGPGPVPLGVPGFNTGLWDGDDLVPAYPPFSGSGLNLIEPNLPTPGVLPDPGDNLDAYDGDQPPNFPIFYSLDSFFPDPLEIFPVNSGTAVGNGVVGGDVLMAVTPGAAVVYAMARQLGLDADGALPDSDDLDALVLGENGDGVYQPVTGPYSWFTAGTDMLFYSVRRGSAIIGTPDALRGLPIEEGDILIPVYNPARGDWDPGIFVPAESLGLSTRRQTGGPDSDDLDALDMLPC